MDFVAHATRPAGPASSRPVQAHACPVTGTITSAVTSPGQDADAPAVAFPSLRNHLLQGWADLTPAATEAVLDEPTLAAAVQAVIAHTHGRAAHQVRCVTPPTGDAATAMTPEEASQVTRTAAPRDADTAADEATLVVYDLTGLRDGLDDRRSRRPHGHTTFAAIVLTAADADDWVLATGPTSQWTGAATGTRPSRGLRGFTDRRTPRPALVRRRREAIVSAALGLATVAIPTVEEIVTGRYPDLRLRNRYAEAALTLWHDARLAQGYTPEAAQAMFALVADPSLHPHLPAP